MDCLTEKTIDDMLCGHVDQSSRAYKGLRMAFLFIKEHGADEFERLAHFLEKSPLPNLSLKQFQEILSKSFNTYLTEKNIDDSFHGLIDQSTVRYKLIKEMVYYGYRQGILLEGYEKYSDIDDLLNKTLNPEEFSESPLPNLSWEQFKQILGDNGIDLNNPEDVATLILTEESIDTIFNGYTDQSAVYYKIFRNQFLYLAKFYRAGGKMREDITWDEIINFVKKQKRNEIIGNVGYFAAKVAVKVFFNADI